MSSLIGQTFAGYRLEALLGSGSVGEVYRGVHAQRRQAAAVKVLHEHLARDAGQRTRFLNEAQAAAALEHPNIIKVHDFGEHQGRHYIVMELAVGGSVRGLLQRRVSSGQPLPWPTGVSLAWQAAAGLQHAHARGLVHRDIKPDNLLLQPRMDGDKRNGAAAAGLADGHSGQTVRIGDFGLAKVQQDAQVTTAGLVVGTAAYVSPEQCQGLELDGRSDVYSLGIVLYEMTTGYLPFEARGMIEALQKHVNEAPPPPRSVRGDLPRELEVVILRCLAKRPDERYVTAAELGTALGNVLASAPPVASSAAPSPRPAAIPIAGTAAADAERPYVAADRAARSEPVVRSTPPPTPSLAGVGTPGLIVTDANGRASTVGALTGTDTSIGRDADNDVVLPDQRVSRHHARIDWNGERALITDLGSGNGTWLDETRLPPNAPQSWRQGATLTVGPFQMRLDASRGAATPGDLSAVSGVAGSGVTSLEFPPLEDAPLPTGEAGRAARRAGRARLLLERGGERQDAIDLSEGATLVGRGHENHVALRERSVSRRHVRIEWDGRQATVTDLGSDNGTWLGRARLAPDTPQPWSAEESLRVGPYHLRLDLAADPAVSGTAVGRVQMIVHEPALALTPGSPAIVRGSIANLGNIVDHMWVEAQGVPKEWITGSAMSQVENQMLQLNPGAQAPVVLTVNVPRTPESLAGQYHVRLIARSRANPQEMGLAQVTWTVLPFTGSTVALDRLRSSGRRATTVGVVTRNDGNTPARYSLDATDPERRLDFRFAQTVVDVGPGKEATVQLRIRAPWHWLGAPRARAFSVGLHPSEGEAPAPAPGEFLQIALIPQWLPKAAAALIPLALIGAILLQSWIVGLLRPRILSFAAPASVVAGEPVAVSWSVERAQSVQVEGLTAPADVTPTPLGATGRHVLEQGLEKDLQLKLVAANVFGPSESARTIAVLTRTPTPTATATPTTPPTPTPETPAPLVEVFRVEPASIVAGDQVTVIWQVRDAQVVMIEGLSASQLSASGQLTHRPERSTTYVLTASNQGRPAEPRAIELIVRTPTPSPTRSPTATPPPLPTPPPS